MSSYAQVKASRAKRPEYYRLQAKLRRRLKNHTWFWRAASKADPQTDAHKHR